MRLPHAVEMSLVDLPRHEQHRCSDASEAPPVTHLVAARDLEPPRRSRSIATTERHRLNLRRRSPALSAIEAIQGHHLESHEMTGS